MSKPNARNLFPAGEDLPLFTGLNPTPRAPEPAPVRPLDNLGGPSLPLFRTTRVVEFHPHVDDDGNLYGPAQARCVGTPIARVRVSRHDPDKWLVQAGELYAWIWADFVSA